MVRLFFHQNGVPPFFQGAIVRSSRDYPTLCLEKASGILESGSEETFSYYTFPVSHRRHIRTNNPLERLNREIRRRTRVVGSFPDGHAALMLVAARLRYMAGQKWGTERYMNMKQEILLGAYIIEHFPRCGRLKRLQTLFSMNLHVQQ
jgi:hypothetical protein